MNMYIATDNENKIILVVNNEIQYAINPECKEWQDYLDSGQELIEKQPTENHIFIRDEWVFNEVLAQENKQFKLNKLRAERDSRLTKLDSYQGVLRYNALTETQQTELATYRQALLDAPETGSLPEVPTWF